MSNRITQKDLEILTKQLNEALGRPIESHSRGENGQYKANIGNFHLSYAYGGVALEEMTSEGGGKVRTSPGGYGTKRELYQWMTAYLSGIQAGGSK